MRSTHNTHMIGQLRLQLGDGTEVVATMQDDGTWETTSEDLAEYLSAYVLTEENEGVAGWRGHEQLQLAADGIGAVVELEKVAFTPGRVY